MKAGDKLSLQGTDYHAYYEEFEKDLIIEGVEKNQRKILYKIKQTLEDFMVMNLSDEHLESILKQLHDEKIRRIILGIYNG